MRILFLSLLFFTSSISFAQNVGIGTTTPNASALLHIDLGTSTTKGFLITGVYTSPASVPDMGAGTRLMFYPGKAAFRVGGIDGTQWNDFNVGYRSNSIGYNTVASGYISTAFGNTTTASGDYSTAIGVTTIAIGTGSTAMGISSRAGGDYSTAMGLYTSTKGYSSTVIGMYNDSILTGNQSAPTSLTPLFIIGKGDDYFTRSNAMVVLKSGDIGISTNVPAARTHIKTNSQVTYPQLMLEESENDYARMSFKNTTTTNVWSIAATPQPTNTASLMNFYYQGFGDVLSLHGDGSATLYGILTQSSDSRLKKNIRPLTNSLEEIKQLSGYRYEWIDAKMDNTTQIGILAQEIQKIYPELVREDDKGMLSVNYSGLIPVLISAVKEQQQQIDELKNENQELKTLQNEIEHLKKIVTCLSAKQ